jgi:hypothetical protein
MVEFATREWIELGALVICAFRPIRALRPAIAGSSERCRSGGVINTSGCRFWCQRLVLSSSAVQAVPVVHRRAPRVL